uniref:Uncharacterized protein n=1 Tax=Lotus japonicus TaxID=34305 RepID=I3T214_LOTJA|nr:unknown [Lotus japonicus]
MAKSGLTRLTPLVSWMLSQSQKPMRTSACFMTLRADSVSTQSGMMRLSLSYAR